jgi:hypothetical protein
MTKSGKLLLFREILNQNNYVKDFNDTRDAFIHRVFESSIPININQSDIIIPEGLSRKNNFL